jgi:hypothetical protein
MLRVGWSLGKPQLINLSVEMMTRQRALEIPSILITTIEKALTER